MIPNLLQRVYSILFVVFAQVFWSGHNAMNIYERGDDVMKTVTARWTLLEYFTSICTIERSSPSTDLCNV